MTLTLQSLFVLALFVSGIPVCWNYGLADELPKDTNEIETLTPQGAKDLVARFPGKDIEVEIKGIFRHPAPQCLPLNGLKTLDAETASALAAYGKAGLVLNGLETLDAATANALAGCKCQWLFLNGVTKLEADAARALSAFKGRWLWLCGLTTLNVDTAKSLAAFKGKSLCLNGVTELDADVGKALAHFEGKTLYLAGLEKIDAETARALAGSTGRFSLSVPGLNAMDAAAAKALAANERWDGALPSLTSFESPDAINIAATLATFKGRLALPKLKRISPKTLSALIVKEDIEIPPIETLDLIPEPDGSVTEDFVIPEGFRERQLKQDN
jgi:hypothetical protein